MNLNDSIIGIIGLGYVGLPLAIEFGKRGKVVGFDIDKIRINEINQGRDSTLEISSSILLGNHGVKFTADINDLINCDVFIVTVPTPVDSANQPNLAPLISASKAIGGLMKSGSVVIYESTVYPGATEEICVPELEKSSGLVFNETFYCGYSPERINPGDRTNTLTTIKKITSGSTKDVAIAVDKLYQTIIKAGTFMASSIKVAEAAKVIENTQRDLNIAFVNELSLIFHRLDIDTLEVLEAASTKWNFLKFRPGLVGGHCIGVDPYYLTHKAQELGYYPEVILSGRRINNNIVHHIVDETVRKMIKNRLPIMGGRLLILGLTFKENCPDIRNTKVVDLMKEFNRYGLNIDIYDPWVNAAEAKKTYGLDILDQVPEDSRYSAIILAVGHNDFIEMGVSRIYSFGIPKCILFDVKGIFPKESSDLRL